MWPLASNFAVIYLMLSGAKITGTYVTMLISEQLLP